ncbi:MAG: methionyl-tRNA formyltransferase [bacterium]
MGTPEIASESLVHILELCKLNIINLKSVYTKPPVWNNKRKESVISPVNKLALEHNINVRTPGSFKSNAGEMDFLKSLDIDLIIVVAFGIILPAEILNIPKYGALNLHPSLLPDLRGPSPIHYAILKRIKFTGVSIMALDAGVDTGPVIAQQRIDIDKNEYYQSLYEKLSLSGAFLLAEVIKTIFKFKLNMYECGFPQSLNGADSFALSKLIGPDELKVDFFIDEPIEIYAKARALAEAGGAFFIFRGKNVKIIEVRLIAENEELEEKCSGGTDGLTFDYCDYADYYPKNGNNNKPCVLNNETNRLMPGIIVSANKSGLLVSTVKKGVYIQLLKLKPEGKNIINYTDFINGYRIKPGDICR